MTGDFAGKERARYRAFISYSHRDAAFGRRLHRRLEAYRVPRRLVGRETPQGPVPRRLVPIFRDREELPAANDLTTEVRAALAASGALIVVCSPSAAASPWVSREIEVFRELHPDRPVLAAIVDGEPADAFPGCLSQPNAAGEAVEPLAADFRKGRDGERLGLLKLVAGVVGLGLDELVQRDAQTRLQRVTAVTAAALVLAVGMGGLALYALDARAEAERQRGEAERQRGGAEGLVDFMQLDLRQKLKTVGRLDVMAAANERAFAYYRGQDLRRLSPESLERRVRILQAMGEDDIAANKTEAANEKLGEAARTTAALLVADPDNPKRIYAHAQSEFWIGSLNLHNGRPQAAAPRFRAYKRLAERLVSISPGNVEYRREVAFADGNLCTVALEEPKDVELALTSCAAALRLMRTIANDLRAEPGAMADVANRHAWMADAYRARGDSIQAQRHRRAQESILRSLLEQDPKNMRLKAKWVTSQRALAGIAADFGDRREARTRLVAAKKALNQMVAFDPSNMTWRDQLSRVSNDLALVDRTKQTTLEKHHGKS